MELDIDWERALNDWDYFESKQKEFAGVISPADLTLMLVSKLPPPQKLHPILGTKVSADYKEISKQEDIPEFKPGMYIAGEDPCKTGDADSIGEAIIYKKDIK